ncbi:PaaI family thioesterase [Hydrogenophaga sp.]|uniref:PaaI family thioesterase n=1 Tax=Hydrogenophaga sp. TaxID=1904254 RepID=UPI002606691C|nr:PaaI family thioesterase [Hydrogenophaga sp.]MCW5652134.1 PaaI family thioesterase [Hydrogenophaga sp.]
MHTPPEGFHPAPVGGRFAIHNGPLFARWTTDQRLVLGFRVEERHTNPGNQCHGGMLGLFADIFISTAAQYQTDIPRQFLPTISLDLDFLAGAPLGSWIEGRADVLKVTRNLIFSQGLITADGEPVVRASGVFKRGPLLPESASDTFLTLPGMHRK